ncbi:MAG: sugar ABC transporter permease [Defluviitaleaceae bacterium]|nr:sugar ABC transporter permease [Defluviitaleaceae bacterium]
MTAKREKRISYALLVFPAVAIYLAVVTFPTIFSIVLSFTNYNGGPVFGPNANIEFVGFNMYRWMFTEPTRGFFLSFRNNMLIVAVSVFGQIPLGFILAYIISRKLIRRGRAFFQSMIFLPFVISPVIIGVLFNVFIRSPQSVLIEVAGFLGIAQMDVVTWLLRNPMIPVLAVILWMFTGFYMVIFIAHFNRIDPEVIEAARIDGSSEGRILTRIVLPLMSNEIITMSILAISGSLRTFDLIYVMTAGGPAGQTRVLSLFMYQSAFQAAANYPLANAISTVMVLTSILLIIIVRAIGKYLSRNVY